MSDAQTLRRASVVADLAAGATLLATSLKHDVAQATASRWFAQSGQTREHVARGKLAPEKRKAIERMLRDDTPLADIRRRSGASKSSILKVRADLEARQQKAEASHA